MRSISKDTLVGAAYRARKRAFIAQQKFARFFGISEPYICHSYTGPIQLFLDDGIYRSYRANVGDDKVIALTFDDGPWPETTEAVLDVLHENDAKGTFFVVGENLEKYPDISRRALSEGHMLCNHTYSHAQKDGEYKSLANMSQTDQIVDVIKGFHVMSDVLGVEPSRYIRVPGGNFSKAVPKNLKPYIKGHIFYTVDTVDWSIPGKEAILERLSEASSGDIVLMHDGRYCSLDTPHALAEFLPKMRKDGYRFITIDELLEYPLV